MVPNDWWPSTWSPGFRQVHEDDVAQLALRVVGDADADDGRVAGPGDVLVLLGVDEIVRNIGQGGLRRGVAGGRIGGVAVEVKRGRAAPPHRRRGPLQRRRGRRRSRSRSRCARASPPPAAGPGSSGAPPSASRPRWSRAAPAAASSGASTSTIDVELVRGRPPRRAAGCRSRRAGRPAAAASAISSARRACTAGCTIRLSAASASGSASTTSAERGTVERAVRPEHDAPNDPRSAGAPGSPGACTSRTISSASMHGGAPPPEEVGDGGLAGGDVAGERDVQHRTGPGCPRADPA